MGNWFDNLCLRLAAKQEIPQAGLISTPITGEGRRSFLKAAFSGTTLGFLGSSAPSNGQSSGQLSRIPVQKQAVNLNKIVPKLTSDQCQRSWNGAKMTQSVSITQGNVSVQYSLTYDASAKSLTTAVSFAQGSTPIRSSTFTGTTGGAQNVQLTYGAAFSGVKNASFNTKDGKTIQGTVDGRAVSIQRSAEGNYQTEFLDHRPASTVTIAPTTQNTITALATQVDTKLRSCYAASSQTTSSRGTVRDLTLKPGGNGPNDPGDNWYESGGTYEAPSCNSCLDGCATSGVAAISGGGGLLGIVQTVFSIADPATAAAEIAAYYVAYAKCLVGCYAPGGGCCPVACGSLITCCGQNDQCFHTDLCCPSGMAVCNNVCCGSHISTCASDGTCGCPTGMLSCQEQCCEQGQICCGGICTAPTDCDNGCVKPKHFCNGVCCNAFEPCCNGQCCKGTCINNSCCPTAAQVCGQTCCPAGQVCNNGSCMGCTNTLGAILKTPCHSLGRNNVTIGVCCPITSPTCCGGVCCGNGQNYCAAANGTYVCTNVNPNPIR